MYYNIYVYYSIYIGYRGIGEKGVEWTITGYVIKINIFSRDYTIYTMDNVRHKVH